MAHGTYDNPRAGSSSSKNRMGNLINKVNGNGDDDVTYRKYKGKDVKKIGNWIKIPKAGDKTGVVKETSISHDYRGPVLTKKKIVHTQPEQGVRTMYYETEKKSKEKVISQKRADRISKRLEKKNVDKGLKPSGRY
jgi:hypothetical protein